METAIASKISRIRGWVLVIIGPLLSLGIAAVAAYLTWAIFHKDRPDGPHWTGSHDFTVRVFGLFAVIFVFGLVALAGGIFQLRRGRASKLVIVAMLLLVAVMFLLGLGIVNGTE